MPYIADWHRADIADGYSKPSNAGELNFRISTIILAYLGDNPNYQMFNDVVGVLELAKAELIRRSIGNYEDLKVLENGDLPYPYRRNVE